MIITAAAAEFICHDKQCKSMSYENKCIGDDTKAAARQSPNCILKNKNK